MNFLEKDLEDIIWDNMQTKEGLRILQNRGLVVNDGQQFRQPNLSTYGVPDIVVIRSNGSWESESLGNYVSFNAQVIELKKGKVTCEDISQICRYARGIEDMSNHFAETLKANKESRVSINKVLIGNGFSDAAMWIASQLKITCLSYEFDIQKGLVFKPLGKNWVRSNFDLQKTFIKDASYKRMLTNASFNNILDAEKEARRMSKVIDIVEYTSL